MSEEVTNWFDSVEGLTDDHKSFITEKKYADIGSVIDAAKTPASWVDGLTPEHKGLIEAKGFQDLGTLINSYDNLEKLKGVPESHLVRVPEKNYDEDPKGWEATFSKLGRPDKPEEYKIALPENAGEAEKEIATWVQGTFHKLGFTKQQGEGFINQWNTLTADQQKIAQEKFDAETREADRALKVQWGQAYEKNKKDSLKAAVDLGLNEDQLVKIQGAIGEVKMMEMFYQYVVPGKESGFVDGKVVAPGVMTPDAANYEIDRLKQDDEWVKKWMSGDVDARKRLDRLTEMANAGLTQ